MPMDRNPRLRALIRAACLLYCLLVFESQAAPLTEAEKQLLQVSISKEAAIGYGRAADAGGLAKIVKLKDPALVLAFETGMGQALLKVLPPDVEALVIANFDDPIVGPALRGFRPRYQTRRLFDLHYARIKAANKNDDPSFAQILNTDITGIEEALLQVAQQFPLHAGETNRVVMFLGRRKYPGAVPLLIAALPQSYRAIRFRNPIAPNTPPHYLINEELHCLMDYPSVEVWRKTRVAIDGFNRAGQITDEIHAAADNGLDALLNDADKALAQRKRSAQTTAYERTREAIFPGPNQISMLKASDQRRYVGEYAVYLAKLEVLAAKLGNELNGNNIGADYFRLGVFVRFRMRDVAQALVLFAKSAHYRYALGQIAVADTYQFEMRDSARAAQAYQLALDDARKPAQPGAIQPYSLGGVPMNDWFRSWLAQEIEYLKAGKPFNGVIGEAEIDGFFATMRGNVAMVADTFEPDLPMLNISTTSIIQGPAGGASPNVASGWSQIEAALTHTNRDALAPKLAGLPSSRLALLATIRQWSALPDADAILRYLDRNDPSGYWSACLLGAVFAFDQKGEAGRNEALRNGTAQLMPGLAAPGKPNALATAAGRFMRAHGVRAEPKAATNP
jgi:hypothetical protein